jgi:hypothetical protein
MVTSNVHNGGVPSGFMSKWTHILNEGSLAPSNVIVSHAISVIMCVCGRFN